MLFSKKFSSIFKNKRVIVLSDNGIESKEITNFSKVLRLLSLSWFIFATVAFFYNTKIQLNKDKIINDLQSVNAKLNNNIKDLDYIVGNIKDYLTALNFYDRFNDIDIKRASTIDERLKNDSYITIAEYKNILPILDNLDRSIANIDILVNSRINGINNILKEASLDDNVKELYNVNYSNFNDVKTEDNVIFKDSILVKRSDFAELRNNIEYMNFLESFLNSIPIAKPMKNYYISSKFGSRIDPFTKKVKTHRGLDFVGPYDSVVYAPADGVVDIVAVRGGFGNSIEINHGNDIKTEYAHLKQALVKPGDVVKRGDKIAVQGTTGRSTGQHLHWEVKVRRKNVDPMKFIKIGERMF